MEKAKEILDLARENDWTVSSCESLTAGLFCDTLATTAGASCYLKGGLVTYFTEMKTVLAHVPASLIETYGVVSKQCAESMAENTREIMNTDYCVSFTGNAGPDAWEGKPVGDVYCAIACKDGCITYHLQLDETLSRNEIRSQCVQIMMDHLIRLMKEHSMQNRK